MFFKIRKIRGVYNIREEDIKSKRFNIWVGISLENKWFTKENLRDYILWALKYTKNKVAVLIADTLHIVNYEIVDGYSPDRAFKRAIKKGNEMYKVIQEIINELPEKKRESVSIVRWEELKKDKNHVKSRAILYREFKINTKFRDYILGIVRLFIDRLNRNFSKEEVDRLATYILDELTELLSGFKHRGVYYDLYPYPKNTQVAEFVEKIQNKRLFPELHNKINIKNNICVWLEK